MKETGKKIHMLLDTLIDDKGTDDCENLIEEIRTSTAQNVCQILERSNVADEKSSEIV